MFNHHIFLTDFARDRHFNPEFAGTKITDKTPAAFMEILHEGVSGFSSLPLRKGYAPFCKHLFIPNPTNAKMGVHPITDDNRHLLQVGYEARREGELPVLTSWFNQADIEPETCTWLDLVLYSAKQLRTEGVEVPEGMEWGIVAILSSNEAEEAPMQPITMMRNALGKDQGGSGVPLDPEAYQAAVAYWSKFATIR